MLSTSKRCGCLKGVYRRMASIDESPLTKCLPWEVYAWRRCLFWTVVKLRPLHVNPVTGTNFVVFSYEKFQPGTGMTFKKQNQNGGAYTCIVRDRGSFVDSYNIHTYFTIKLIRMHTFKVKKHTTQLKIMPFWTLLLPESEAILSKTFGPGQPGSGCSYIYKNSSRLPRSCRETKISVTEPARLLM